MGYLFRLANCVGAVAFGRVPLLVTGVVTLIAALFVGRAHSAAHAAAMQTRTRARRGGRGRLTVFEVTGHPGESSPTRSSGPFWTLVTAAINTALAARMWRRKKVCGRPFATLGDSITGLPLLASDGTPDDPAAFQLQADQLGAEADAERDPVIAASLRRRADALHRQAETAARTNTLLRRNEALRQEIAGQIAALQTSLTALRVGGAQAVYELADVAANIQQVAIEAGAITQARSEIGDIVSVARQ